MITPTAITLALLFMIKAGEDQLGISVALVASLVEHHDNLVLDLSRFGESFRRSVNPRVN